jgi:hypothetical protein
MNHALFAVHGAKHNNKIVRVSRPLRQCTHEITDHWYAT